MTGEKPNREEEIKNIIEKSMQEGKEAWTDTNKLKTDSKESKIIQEAIYKIEIKIYNEIGFIIDEAFKDLVEG